MSPEEHDTLMEIALASVEGFRTLAYAAGGAVDTLDGTLCWYSSSYVPLFNGAAVLSSLTINPDALRTIDQFFVQRGRPYCLMMVDGLVPLAFDQLQALGYMQYETFPAMLLEGSPQRWAYPPVDLRVVPVESSRDLDAFRRVLSRVFAMAPSEVELVMSDRVLEAKNARNYLGLMGRTPVATATMVLDGRMAGIWNVGTLAEFRRLGIAAEIMHRALGDARLLGYGSSMLLSSPEGVSLYERLGYRIASTVRILVNSSPELR